MSQLIISRYHHDELPTIGIVRINAGQPICFSLEDRKRAPGVKVAGDTRIPSGSYPLVWREWGTWAARFKKWGYPGSLVLKGVPGFTDILIHVGNDHEDTAGCLLLGFGADLVSRTITKSRMACRHVYQKVMDTGGEWQVTIG